MSHITLIQLTGNLKRLEDIVADTPLVLKVDIEIIILGCFTYNGENILLTNLDGEIEVINVSNL